MLSNHLPKFMLDEKEIACIMKTQDYEFDSIDAAVGKSLDNSFAAFADETESGLDRWERLFKIPYKTSRSVEERRREILSRLANFLPYTYNALQETLVTLYGDNGTSRHLIFWKVDENKLSFLFKTELEESFEEIERFLKRWLPANMVIDIQFVGRRHSALAEYIHSCLRRKTHLQIRKEGLEGGFF